MQSSIGGFTQAIIAFWFRVPQKSIDDAKAEGEKESKSLLKGVIPLVVMGKKGKGASVPEDTINHNQIWYIYTPVTYQGGEAIGTSEGDFFGLHTITITYTAGSFVDGATQEEKDEPIGMTFNPGGPGEADDTDPTLIGIDCNTEPTLYVNIESTNKPSVSGFSMSQTSITPAVGHGYLIYDRGEHPPQPASLDEAYQVGTTSDTWIGWLRISSSDSRHWVSGPMGSYTPGKYGYTDVSEGVVNATGNIYDNSESVSADTWHHVIISMELGNVSTHGKGSVTETGKDESEYVNSACKLYFAFDGKNKASMDQSFGAEGRGNEEITDDAARIAGSALNQQNFPFADPVPISGPAQYSVDISVPGGDIGIPATGEFVDKIHRVEMAEFYMWLGKSADLTDDKIIRAFITEDKKPVPPHGRPASTDKDGNPTDPVKGCIDMLGEPDIMLHRSGNFKNGKNTGKNNTDFTVFGKVKRFKPDPGKPEPKK